MAKKAVRKATKKPVSKKGKTSPQKDQPGFLGFRPISCVLFGPPGVGKTDLGANFPDPGFIYDVQETGIVDLHEYGQTAEPKFMQKAESFEDILELNLEIAAGNYNIKTAVYDSLTGIEQLIFASHCREHFDGDWSQKGFYAYQQGPKNAAKTDVPKLLDSLEDVRKSGVSVVLIAHSEVKTFSNPEGPDYERFLPKCDKETWGMVHRWAGCIFFYNYYVDIEQRKQQRGSRLGKGKANTDRDQRFIHTVWSPAYDAKNRFGLDPLIDAGGSGEEAFQNLSAAFLKLRK